jgi:hypothetical protein
VLPKSNLEKKEKVNWIGGRRSTQELGEVRDSI